MCDRCSEAPALSRRELLRKATALGLTLPFAMPLSHAVAATRTRKIICKSSWRARPTKGRFRKHTIRRLTVHHSGVELHDNRDAPQRFRDAQRYHQEQGWPDIAYHVLIDLHGNIYKGRPSWAEGDTFTEYDPRGHFLVMAEGNFSEQRIPDAAYRAVRDVLAWAAEEFGVSPRTIKGHRDYASTACPGNDLYRPIRRGSLQNAVERRIDSGGVDLEKLCGEAGDRRVRRIERGDN